MKKITKLVAMLMAMVLLLSLCGCGDDSKKVVGKWSYEVDLQDAIMEEMGSDEFADFDSTLPVVLIFDFQKDGNLELSVDEDKFLDAYEGWLSDFTDFAADYMYDMAAENGMTKDDIDAYLGADAKSYFTEMMNDQVDPQELVKDMKTTGVWKAKGGKLYISEGTEIEANRYDNYKIDGNTMTISLADGAEAEDLVPGMEYPFVLNKMN